MTSTSAREVANLPERFHSAPGRRAAAFPIEHTCDGTDLRNCRCVKERLAARQRQRRATTPEQNRKANLKRLYGITLADYEALRAAQDHRCASCGRHEDNLPPIGGRRRKDGTSPMEGQRLVVDHCHTRGDVRALLCQGCNVALGAADEDADRLRAIAEYAEKWRR